MVNSSVYPLLSGVETVSFAKRFVTSDAFKVLFREGMALVEETALYLDGPGREESRLLVRLLSLGYATESMRLTTRLMQAASWLLIQRAVAEGELSLQQAQEEQNRVRLSDQSMVTAPEVLNGLPEYLRGLIERSLRLQARILHLNAVMEADRDPDTLRETRNPVANQISLVQEAFRYG